jgi:hypothetical protein
MFAQQQKRQFIYKLIKFAQFFEAEIAAID